MATVSTFPSWESQAECLQCPREGIAITGWRPNSAVFQELSRRSVIIRDFLQRYRLTRALQSRTILRDHQDLMSAPLFDNMARLQRRGRFIGRAQWRALFMAAERRVRPRGRRYPPTVNLRMDIG